jgi:hypothetical protein
VEKKIVLVEIIKTPPGQAFLGHKEQADIRVRRYADAPEGATSSVAR